MRGSESVHVGVAREMSATVSDSVVVAFQYSDK